jgi:hypothetical protein
MIPNYNNRQVESSGIAQSAAFGISDKDTAHIMGILRDTLYSDKVLAVLREYSSNAWDAHREVGKHNVPISVTLPTPAEPTLSIQDFGPGLSHEAVFEVYTQYGASTKRGSDLAVGMLGIGSKSGFAYSDSFVIVSCYGGMRRSYVALLDETEKGTINLLGEEECGEATGVTIQIPVRTEDIPEFVEKAKTLFQYFIPRPDINVVLPDPPASRLALSHGALRPERYSQDGWTAVMGCVPYRINIDQVKGKNAPHGGVGEHISDLSGLLYFNIGEVQISASREELKYTPETKSNLVKRFEALVDEYVRMTIDSIEANDQITIWEKRIRAQVLNRLRLPIPKEFKDLIKDTIEFDFKKKPTKSFTLVNSRALTTETSSMHVGDDIRIIIKDDSRKYDGFDLSYHDYLARPNQGFDVATVEKELEKWVTDEGLLGIPVVKLSTLPWTAPYEKPKAVANKKHRVTTFVLKKDHTRFHHPYAQAWEVQKRVPTDDDVFVILRKFQAFSYSSFFSDLHEDRWLAGYFKRELPPIYGYKDTVKKPLAEDKCKGTHYRKWRDTFVRSLLTDQIKKQLETYEWSTAINVYYGHKKKIEHLKEILDKSHPIYLFFSKHERAKRRVGRWGSDLSHMIETIADRIYDDKNPSPAKQALEGIFAKYPLLKIVDLHVLWMGQSKQWAEYVQMVDKFAPTLTPVSDEEEDEEDE